MLVNKQHLLHFHQCEEGCAQNEQLGNKELRKKKEGKAHFLYSWLGLRLLLPCASFKKRLRFFDSAVCKKKGKSGSFSPHCKTTGFKSANVSAQFTSVLVLFAL